MNYDFDDDPCPHGVTLMPSMDGFTERSLARTRLATAPGGPKKDRLTRDAAILTLRRRGWSLRLLGDAFGLSRQAIVKICRQMDTLTEGRNHR